MASQVMLEREKDPSKLEAPYGGKLVQYLVSDGAHVNKGAPRVHAQATQRLFKWNLSVQNDEARLSVLDARARHNTFEVGTYF
eukprot:781010-Pleurochrysis_carterae.AAC.1